MSERSRHGAPVLIRGAEVRPLNRVTLGASIADAGHREAFIQQLVHEHPEVLPMREIEPAYTPLISVCRELPSSAGYLDNLWVTPEGGLVLGECKLAKNPQSRREVVAQALDYAQAMGSWGLEDLEKAIGLARSEPGFRLWSLVSDHASLEEDQFNDAVERRLRQGRMMVLIIGDGIQEGAEALTSYLQLHAGVRAGLALVDLSIWEGDSGSLIVVPRIPMRTVLIERGIVTVAPSGEVKVLPPQATALAPKAQTASEPEFYDQLQSRRPALVGPLQAFAARLGEVGVTPEYRKSLVLRWMPTPDVTASAGYVDASGIAWLGDSFSSAKKLGNPAAGTEYLDTLARSVGGTVKERSTGPIVVSPTGRTVTADELLQKPGVWLAAVERLVSQLSAASEA